MTPGTDERTAPDTASGAVSSPPRRARSNSSPTHLTERAVWHAVAATLVPVPRRRQR